jgi:hypothetical protein
VTPTLRGVSVVSQPRRVGIDLASLRLAGGAMLGAALLWPLKPDGVGNLTCAFHSLTGIPCPLCGMTRSVTATVHLRLHDALAANPAGILAVVVAIVLLVRPPRPLVSVPRWAVPVGLAALWSCQLLRLPFT